MIHLLDESFIKNTIKTNDFEFRFKYNTESDYFYYDLFNLDGDVVSFNNKVVTGFQRVGFKFESDNNDSFANFKNISTFKLITDDN